MQSFKEYFYQVYLENDEDDTWIYWLEDNEYGITIEDFKKLIQKYKLSYVHIIKNKIAELTDGQSKVYLEFDLKSNELDVWAWNLDEVSNKIENMDDFDILNLLGLSEEDVYISGWECTIKDAQEHPGTVYHYTTEDKWDDIQLHGGMKTSYGTGLTNRGAVGIFTSVDAEEHALGTYGDVCLAIDLSSYKTDNNISRLNLSPEPEVLETELKNILANKFGLDDISESSSDMSIFTMIVGHGIPLKYIKRIN